jgi:lipopolysaccharide export system protein LptA
VYDLEAGVATVETTPGGRVKALFVPGNNNNADGGAKADGKAAATTGAAAAAAGSVKPKRPATASN